ncbi:MAG: histidine kinase, partial [Oscillospiraceae bacterium]|nr:histidine kinase [Oscillospiraceae bacterium]
MKKYAIFARLFAGITLLIAWGLTDSPLLGVAFVLVLTALSAARYRFGTPRLLRLLQVGEAAACAGFAVFWTPALLGLWLPLIGYFEDKWDLREEELLKMDFEDRAERLKLEADRQAAALQLRNIKHAAEINERERIAQEIHDHVGHEVAGALFALQAAARLFQGGSNPNEKAEKLLLQTIARLESASENLRETVHNLKPAKTARQGLSALEELCEGFTFCKVSFTAAGFSGSPPQAIIDVLAANLKEALTNVSRHSNATLVTVEISANADYVRMAVGDNGGNAVNRSNADKRTRPDNTANSNNRDNRSNAGNRGNAANSDNRARSNNAANPRHFKAGMGLSGMKERV